MVSAGMHGVTGIMGAARSFGNVAGANERDRLEDACRQFEAIFIETMLKSARASLPQDGLFSSKEQRTYQEMLDSETAAQMAQGNGIGLAKYIMDDILRRGQVSTDGTK